MRALGDAFDAGRFVAPVAATLGRVAINLG